MASTTERPTVPHVISVRMSCGILSRRVDVGWTGIIRARSFTLRTSAHRGCPVVAKSRAPKPINEVNHASFSNQRHVARKGRLSRTATGVRRRLRCRTPGGVTAGAKSDEPRRFTVDNAAPDKPLALGVGWSESAPFFGNTFPKAWIRLGFRAKSRAMWLGLASRWQRASKELTYDQRRSRMSNWSLARRTDDLRDWSRDRSTTSLSRHDVLTGARRSSSSCPLCSVLLQRASRHPVDALASLPISQWDQRAPSHDDERGKFPRLVRKPDGSEGVPANSDGSGALTSAAIQPKPIASSMARDRPRFRGQFCPRCREAPRRNTREQLGLFGKG